MKILFFTKGDKIVGSSRQRIWFIAERLQKAYDISYEVVHSIKYSSWSLSPTRIRELRRVQKILRDQSFDIIYVHKSLFPLDVILLIIYASRGRRMIYDLDDGEWLHSPLKSWLLARFAEQIVTGSHEIFAWARRHNKRVSFIPTVIDHKLYTNYIVSHTPRSEYTIGWVGSAKGHFIDGNFTVLRTALENLSRKGRRLRFVIVGAQHYEPLKKYFKSTSFETIYIDELQWQDPSCTPKKIFEYQFDIGCLPLADIAVSRAKCGYKAIEYMACGVPVVASPVGENSIVVENYKTGLLARTAEEWERAIEKLLKDVSLRERMGKMGIERVKNVYSYDAAIPQYKPVIFPDS